MALSNIFREPRREITETVVGVILPAIYFTGITLWGLSEFSSGDRLCEKGCDSQFAYLVFFGIVVGGAGMVAMIIAGVVLVGIHALGEYFCEALEGHNIRLRPRRPSR